FRIHQRLGGLVGVGVAHVVADLRDHLRIQQVVDEGVGLLDVPGIRRDGQHVEPQVGAFLGNGVADLDALAGLFGAVGGLEHVAGIAHGHADIAVGQIGDVFGGMEVGDVGAHFQQPGLGVRIVLGILAVGV